RSDGGSLPGADRPGDAHGHDSRRGSLAVAHRVRMRFALADRLAGFREHAHHEPARTAMGNHSGVRPRIGYTHCKNVKLSPTGYDWNLPLRYGDINYFRVLQALRSAGYSGPLAIEYCGTGDPDV